jgi:hypothetical protein
MTTLKAGWVAIVGDELGELGRVWFATPGEAHEFARRHRAFGGPAWATVHYCD